MVTVATPSATSSLRFSKVIALTRRTGRSPARSCAPASRQPRKS
jgi:hypothetical protein